MEIDLSSQSSAFREAVKPITLEDVLDCLPKDAALVDFLEVRQSKSEPAQEGQIREFRGLLAFVVRHREDVPHIEMLNLGPVSPLSDAIDTWRTTFGMSGRGAAAGRMLRETVWAPIEKHLEGTNLVLVSVDGALGRLPLGALPGKEPRAYVLEEHRLVMLPAPQLLPELVNDIGSKELPGQLLLLGDVDYDADPMSQTNQSARKLRRRSDTALVRGEDAPFRPLAATAEEVASIKELFTELFNPAPETIKTLRQANATEQGFREAAPRFHILHLATARFLCTAG